MDTQKDPTNRLKPEIIDNITQQILIKATSEDNWQASTSTLRQICRIACSDEGWERIQSFVWERLKLKEWRIVLKTLILVEFILKNGSEDRIQCFKQKLDAFESFMSFTCLDNGMDRGSAIRQRAKAIVQLLTDQEVLEAERAKAKIIKEKMEENSGSGSTDKEIGSSKHQR